MSHSNVDLSLEKLQVQSDHCEISNAVMQVSDSTLGTGVTELDSSMSEAHFFNSSIDFNRHSTGKETSHRFRGDDSGSLNWEDSFAVDDGTPDQRNLLRTNLDTVFEPELDDELPIEKVNESVGLHQIPEHN